jgi:MFS family permease
MSADILKTYTDYLAVIGLGYAIGPPIGGALSQHVGWQVCYDVKKH